MSTPTLEVADVIRAHGDEYRKTQRLPRRQVKVLRALVSCRTAILGGHVDRCDSCGHERISYNSCRNRHCPKCGSLAKEKWLRQRERELLPVPYFHIVFTLPDDLNALALVNPTVLYSMLFQTAAETLLCLGRDQKHLGAEIGLIAVLHTWGQNLTCHPHVHCIVPGGGLSVDGSRWIGSRENYFIPVHALSQVFRGKFLASLKWAYRRGKLKCIGECEVLRNKEKFQQLLDRLYSKGWVVYAKQPFGGPEQVLAYLGRYTHRVAISNHRLVSMAKGKVSFRWRDYRDGSKEKVMTLEACEFIRRFLLHVLPDRFPKIRYYGLLSRKKRTKSLAQCRALLGMPDRTSEPQYTKGWEDLLLEITGTDVRQCPKCHAGHMRMDHRLEPIQRAGP